MDDSYEFNYFGSDRLIQCDGNDTSDQTDSVWDHVGTSKVSLCSILKSNNFSNKIHSIDVNKEGQCPKSIDEYVQNDPVYINSAKVEIVLKNDRERCPDASEEDH